jgi:hypothetical protein
LICEHEQLYKLLQYLTGFSILHATGWYDLSFKARKKFLDIFGNVHMKQFHST